MYNHQIILLGCGHYGRIGNKVNIPHMDNRKGLIREICDSSIRVRLFGLNEEDIICKPEQIELVVPRK